MTELYPILPNNDDSHALPMADDHDFLDLIRIFDGLFAETENTRLVLGGDEPLYLPADNDCAFNRIIFANGFFSSALHEISHWCIAGVERRKIVDYGYWYQPDGRSAEEQALFENVEVKPQALEWILSEACGIKFNISIDNLTGKLSDDNDHDFQRRVHRQVLRYLETGLPSRAEMLKTSLLDYYRRHGLFGANRFVLDQQ